LGLGNQTYAQADMWLKSLYTYNEIAHQEINSYCNCV
jgi:hypothetical protein